MGFFDYIFRKVTPANVATRYQVVIYNFRRFSPEIKVSIISDYKVILISPKVNDGRDYDEEVEIILEQNYNSKVISERKILYVTVNTVLENIPINIKLIYSESTPQLDIFQSILTATRSKLLETQEDLNKAKQNKQKSFSDINKVQELLIQKMKEKGLTIDEKKLQKEYAKLCNEVYDGSKDYEIDSLSIDQKTCLIALVVYLCFGDLNSLRYLTQKEKNILENFTAILKYNNHQLYRIIREKYIIDIERVIEEVKTIHMDGPFINFIYTCLDVINESKDKQYTTLIYTKILKDIGFSQEDIDATLKGKYNFRFGNYKDSEETKGKKEEAKRKIIQSWSLLNFAREFGKMQVGSFINKETNREFKACIFTLNNVKTFVSFSSKLGELTPQEIVERKAQLKVAKWVKEDKEGYTLYE